MSKAYLRLNKEEVKTILNWFLFLEEANLEDKEKSTIAPEEIELMNKLRRCVIKMNAMAINNVVMKLPSHYCEMVYYWFDKLPENLIDDIDIDVYESLRVFLESLPEPESDYDSDIEQ